jgi:mannose-6-phosphate isomerase-like protein (cupin superfamily)
VSFQIDENKYIEIELEKLSAISCPCGTTRRAFVDDKDSVASVHLVDIDENARAHYHKKMTEIYVILDGHGWVECDGEKIPVRPMSAVKINPNCRHRAIGKMRILNIAIPAFDASDEWFDRE